MINKKKIAVVVPAHNEEKLIGRVINTMPDFVDLIILVDDRSTDDTITKAYLMARKTKRKLEIIKHDTRQGVGGAVLDGFQSVKLKKFYVAAVMAGDAQMDPRDLKSIVMPIIKGQADFVKGNRLTYGHAWQLIPKVRYLGNSFLSLLTKISSGYWHLADSQAGYVSISRKMIEQIPLEKISQGYGFENDILVYLNVKSARVKEVSIRPIYNIGEKSGMLLAKVGPEIVWLLAKRFFWRLVVKYIIEDFHPLVFFYLTSTMLFIASIPLLVYLLYGLLLTGNLSSITTLLYVFCVIMASMFLFFAMWMDMDYNKELKVK